MRRKPSRKKRQSGQQVLDTAKFRPRRKLDTAVSLWELVHRYETNDLVSPPHQRAPDAWDLPKQRAWIERCRAVQEGVPNIEDPLGIICEYALIDEDLRQSYLNEGLQRVTASLMARHNPEMFDLTKEKAEAILKQTQIIVQHRQYENHRQASHDFILVNRGVLLEPAERHRPVVVYAQGWNKIWSSEIKRWQEAVHSTLSSYARAAKRRTARLARERADYQLFCLVHLGRPKNYGNDDALENLLVECFKATNTEIISKHIKTIQEYSAEIEQAWRSCFPEPGYVMQEALARWCLGVMIVYRNSMSVLRWQEFLNKLFVKTKGAALFNYEDDQTQRPKSLNLSKRIESFYAVAKYLRFAVDGKSARGKHDLSDGLLKEGFHGGHIQPFVDYGDGLVKPKPARINMAESAREIKEPDDHP